MQTVILAGGLGTRIRDVAGDVPKGMIPLGGKPFLEHQCRLLKQHGLQDVVLCVGYGAEPIQAYFEDGARWGMRMDYAREDPEALLGTGGALINAWDLLDDEFLVLYGDSYLPIDYRAVVEAFRASEDAALMTVYKNEGRWDPSNVRIRGNKVILYRKGIPAGEADYIDYGLSAYRKEVFLPYLDRTLPLDLAGIQRDLVEAGRMAAFEVHERFYEIGKPEGLAELRSLLAC